MTPALREWYATGDLEELEYMAMMHAARASLRLLEEDPQAPRRRVVLAADVPDQQVGTTAGFDEPTLVEILAPVPLARVVSGHIDGEVAMADVADAVAALPAADSRRRRRPFRGGWRRRPRTALVRLTGTAAPGRLSRARRAQSTRGSQGTLSRNPSAGDHQAVVAGHRDVEPDDHRFHAVGGRDPR